MFSDKKPFSAITVSIENLTSEAYEEDDLSGVPDLVEVIKLQASGPTEAARAIRKKLKYGSVHRQIRALVILDCLLQNAGSRFQRGFADEPLLERLRVCGASDLSDPAVKSRCRELFRSWSQYGGTPGLEKISRLHKELPKKKNVVTQERSKVVQETDANPFKDEEEEEEAARAAQQPARGSGANAPYGGTSGTVQSFSQTKSSGSSSLFGGSKDKKKKKGKGKGFNLEAEKEQMKAVIFDASTSSSSLMSAMQGINREQERISENQAAVGRFEACKHLRRRVLRYIHNVENEELLAALLQANDELVHALMSFEQFDRSIDADSDSDDELAEQVHLYRLATAKGKEAMANAPSQSSPTAPDLAGLSLDPPTKPAAPPRPPAMSKPKQPPRPTRQEPEDDDDNPFGDENVIETPGFEKPEPRW